MAVRPPSGARSSIAEDYTAAAAGWARGPERIYTRMAQLLVGWSPVPLREQSVRAERLRRLLILHREFDAVPIDDAVAASYGQLAAAVVGAGRRPRARTTDLLIAVTAHAYSARLYTCNASDFVGADTLIEVVSV